MVLLLISFTFFWAYCIFAWATVGMKGSISATYFSVKLPDITFRGFIFGISVPLMFYSYNLSTLLLAAASLIAWVGVAPGSRDYVGDKIENRNHVIGATGGILTAYGGFLAEFVDWKVFYSDLFFWSFITFLIGSIVIMPIGKFKKAVKNHTTWIEVWAYNLVIVTLVIYEILKV